MPAGIMLDALNSQLYSPNDSLAIIVLLHYSHARWLHWIVLGSQRVVCAVPSELSNCWRAQTSTDKLRSCTLFPWNYILPLIEGNVYVVV